MLVVKVPGLCTGGLGVSDSEPIGCICFMRKKKGIDKKRCEFYQENVLWPFVESMRKIFDKPLGGNTAREEDRSVCWSDGDRPQIDAIVNKVTMFEELKITANKQPADLARVFKVVKYMGSDIYS